MSTHRSLAATLVVLTACSDSAGDAAPSPADGPDARPATFACSPADTDSDAFVDCVDELAAEGDATFGHDRLPDIVLGPPMGGGETAGSNDVAALGCGGSITLAFDGPPIVDGPGPELLVFENAFVAGDTTFIEPAQVLVSPDGLDWYAFDCEPDTGEGCAGITPVLAADANTATDPARAGGDTFDLEAIGVHEIRWVRVVDRTREHYGTELWCTGAGGGFDLDAVAHVEAR